MATAHKFYIKTKVNLNKLRAGTSKEVFNNFNEISDCIVHYCDDTNITYASLDISGKLYVHLVNVSILSVKLGMGLGLTLPELKILALGGLLHDIGKLYVPAKILNKPTKLDVKEKIEINKHVELGFNLLPENLQKNIVGEIVLNHHNVFNKDLGPLYNDYVFICGIADVVDAMLSYRPYKKPLPARMVIEEVKNKGGDF